MSSPSISICLPTFNGIATLPEVLERIRAQRLPAEVVAVDSGSTDGTVELMRERADRLIRIPPGTFNHGLTRNLAVESSRGELVVMLVQDALPATTDWLEHLVAPLEEDRWVAGSFARQLPRVDASALSRHALSQWVAAQDAPRKISLAHREALLNLPPTEQLRTCAFDNVCSCLRRSVWRHHPFRRTTIAEDLEWGREVLLAGHSLSFAPRAAVYHSHERGPGYELARSYLIHRRLYELFGFSAIPGPLHLAVSVASSARLHSALARDEARPGARARALGLAVAWPLGQYLGGMSARRGWKPLPTRAV